MKRTLIIFVLVAVLMMSLTSLAFAHPKGPDSMPEEAISGLHTALFRVPAVGKAAHVVFGLLYRTGLCHVNLD